MFASCALVSANLMMLMTGLALLLNDGMMCFGPRRSSCRVAELPPYRLMLALPVALVLFLLQHQNVFLENSVPPQL